MRGSSEAVCLRDSYSGQSTRDKVPTRSARGYETGRKGLYCSSVSCVRSSDKCPASRISNNHCCAPSKVPASIPRRYSRSDSRPMITLRWARPRSCAAFAVKVSQYLGVSAGLSLFAHSTFKVPSIISALGAPFTPGARRMAVTRLRVPSLQAFYFPIWGIARKPSTHVPLRASGTCRYRQWAPTWCLSHPKRSDCAREEKA